MDSKSLSSSVITSFILLIRSSWSHYIVDQAYIQHPKKDFKDFADLCFKTFGDRVKLWVTFNEPYIYAINGYNYGTFAPGRCSSYIGNCTVGNSSTEPYIVGHNMLLAHAAAVKLYKSKYQANQKGEIGITLYSDWFVPMSPESNSDVEAANRAFEFMLGWFADPVVFGDYPEIMKSLVGNRLPKFNQSESELIRGSLDFLGLNYYTANYVKDNPGFVHQNQSFDTDTQLIRTPYKNGVPIGNSTSLKWLFVFPEGFYNLTMYIKNKYNVTMYITENGYPEGNNDSAIVSKELLKDELRIKYLNDHLEYLLKAMKEGAKVKGFYIWSLLDNFEWAAGYTIRFGMIYIDFKNNLTRYLKASSYWFKKFLLH